MSKLTELFRGPFDSANEDDEPNPVEVDLTQETALEQFEKDKSLLSDDASREKRLVREAERTAVGAAEDSLKKLHLMKLGRCPDCGGHLHTHLFAYVCETCGWSRFETPRRTPVRVHLTVGGEPVQGDRVYEIKGGSMLVLRDDVVVAKVPRQNVSWVEYVWSADEVDQRHRQVLGRLEILCGWCSGPADPEKDGFHLTHAAFGASQERYCFCSDECYEAFRKMYPARVDRDCYERNCAECNLCMKRYDDEAEGVRTLAKDFLKVRKRKASEIPAKSGG